MVQLHTSTLLFNMSGPSANTDRKAAWSLCAEHKSGERDRVTHLCDMVGTTEAPAQGFYWVTLGPGPTEIACTPSPSGAERIRQRTR